MKRIVGRAGFHATHDKSLTNRRAVLHEMMRSLNPEWSAHWAAKNSSIVLADEQLNLELVNDGSGGLRSCTSIDEVIAYGESRVARLDRKLRMDEPDKNGVPRGGTMTTSLLVAHLPKSLCREVENFYPRHRKDGSPSVDPATGEPLSRSRWVARDRDEAVRYFRDVVNFLAEHVLPGGHDSVLGVSVQFSESTPHVQLLSDTFGDHPTKPGKLRADASRAWFAHRDVRDENGKIVQGPDKLRRYHAGLKRYLIERGWDVSADFDEERHLVGMGKAEYEETQDLLHQAGVELEAAEKVRDDADRRAKTYEQEADKKVHAKHAGERAVLDRRFADLAARERALEDEWKEPDEAGRGEGPKHRRAREHAERQGRAEVDKVVREVEAERDRLVAIPTPSPIQLTMADYQELIPEQTARFFQQYPKVLEGFERWVNRAANAAAQRKAVEQKTYLRSLIVGGGYGSSPTTPSTGYDGPSL